MVVSESQFVDAVARERAAGRRVAIVSGAFDVLKVGDVRSLQSAAATADRLAVLIHADDPAAVVKAQDRAELVAGLRGVDYVALCSAADAGRLRAL